MVATIKFLQILRITYISITDIMFIYQPNKVLKSVMYLYNTLTATIEAQVFMRNKSKLIASSFSTILGKY